REDVAAHRNLRTFVLVNCSAHSWVQQADHFEPFDQTAVEHRTRLTEYFERHVADDRLIAQLRRREHISLHFCDLMQVARKTFGRDPAEAVAPASESERVVEELREYIFDRDLPRRKLEELK